MNRLLYALLASALLAPAAAHAQFVNVRVDLPEAPPLVVVSPGVQVVENHDEEIFFHDNWYWVRREGHWYRSRQPRAEFVYVEERGVPRAIYGVPPGRYRHYQAVREERRVHAEEARLHEREVRQHEEERRLHEREEAEHRREHHEVVRHEERREVRHEERREAHPPAPAPAQAHGEKHPGNAGEHEHEHR